MLPVRSLADPVATLLVSDVPKKSHVYFSYSKRRLLVILGGAQVQKLRQQVICAIVIMMFRAFSQFWRFSEKDVFSTFQIWKSPLLTTLGPPNYSTIPEILRFSAEGEKRVQRKIVWITRFL